MNFERLKRKRVEIFNIKKLGSKQRRQSCEVQNQMGGFWTNSILDEKIKDVISVVEFIFKI